MTRAYADWEPSTSLKLVELNGYDGPYQLPGAIDGSAPSAPEKLLETKIFQDRFDPSICSRLCDFVSQADAAAAEETFDADFSATSGTYARVNIPAG